MKKRNILFTVMAVILVLLFDRAMRIDQQNLCERGEMECR